jgi:pimeloyl-ACP methyl ester carboxylesterase
MKRRTILAVAAALPLTTAMASPDSETVHEGELNGARYRVEVPQGWNGTLLLWSRAPVYTATPDQPVEMASDPYTRSWLLRNGFALAASNYRLPSSAAFDSALADQIALLEWIHTNLGRPDRTIAWGFSGGGLMSVLLAERYPGTIAGALSLCGVLAGLDGMLKLGLDFATALTNLLGATDIPLVNITDPAGVEARAGALIESALATAAGRARLSLASALVDVPGWFRALQPMPTSLEEQIAAQARYGHWGGFWAGLRADLEGQAGGNPTDNTGVDYRHQFSLSSQADLARRAYAQAGVDLNADLDRLAEAPRAAADPRAASWLARLTPTGRLDVPVLALHSTGDGLAVPEHETAYTPRLKRSVYTARGGHGCFTSSELIVGLRAVDHRIDSGQWPELSPASLNEEAARLGSEYQVAADWGGDFQFKPAQPAFVAHQPMPFPR